VLAQADEVIQRSPSWQDVYGYYGTVTA